jgi:hypothetical protein
MVGALVLGELSYRFVERPFLHPHRATVPRVPRAVGWSSAVASVGVVFVVLANLPTVDPIAASLRAGQQVVAAEHHVVPTTTTTAPAPTTSVVPAPAPDVSPATQLPSAPVSHVAPVPAALPPGPPPGTAAVVAIGDSVMLGAAGPLQARLGSTGYIDAKVSRQFAQGVDVVRQLRDQGRLGQVVVVHLGTNGPPRTADIDAMMNVLSAVPHVLFLTVRMPRSWEAQTNQTLGAARDRYPSAAIVDWYAYSDGHRDWFESDGIHLKPPGARAYADLVGSALPQPTPPPPTATTTTAPPPPSPPPTTSTTQPPTTQPPPTQPPTTTTTTPQP